MLRLAMERYQATVLAVVLAAVVLFGLGYVVDGASDASVPRGGMQAGRLPSDGDPAQRIALWSRESKRAPGGPAGDEPPADERRRRRAAVASGDSAAVIPGAPRRGGAVSGTRRTIELPGTVGGDLLSDDLIAARTGSVPKASGGSAVDGGAARELGPLFEFVEDPPDERGADDVLLSIPLDGDLAADAGDAPTHADGLVVDDGAVEFTEDAQFTFPVGGNVNGEMGTVSFEVEPRWAGSDETNNSLLQIREEHQWENSLAIVKNFDALRFIIRDALGVESNVNILIDDWQPNVRQRVSATWTADAMVLYVNGRVVGRAAGPSGLRFAASTLIHIGSDYPGSTFRGAGGAISNLTVYGRALDAEELR